MYNKESSRKYFQRNKVRRTAENVARMRSVQDWLRNYKRTHPCIQCGEADERCLDFHHRDPETKIIEVSTAFRQGWAIARLMTEIVKCDSLCANCHRKLHSGRVV